MRLAVILQSLRASAGEMGGMMGKKLGLGSARVFPVIRQNDILSLCAAVSVSPLSFPKLPGRFKISDLSA